MRLTNDDNTRQCPFLLISDIVNALGNDPLPATVSPMCAKIDQRGDDTRALCSQRIRTVGKAEIASDISSVSNGLVNQPDSSKPSIATSYCATNHGSFAPPPPPISAGVCPQLRPDPSHFSAPAQHVSSKGVTQARASSHTAAVIEPHPFGAGDAYLKA